MKGSSLPEPFQNLAGLLDPFLLLGSSVVYLYEKHLKTEERLRVQNIL